MCVTCGCGAGAETSLSLHEHEAEHEHVHADGTRHTHSHVHDHDHDHGSVPGREGRLIELEAQILGKNQLVAERNRGWLAGRGILALNLMSSPGAGKTTLLERTLSDLQQTLRIAVVEGDQATSNDAQRIRAAGARAIQINTGTGCHLEADMLERALTVLRPEPGSVVMIENVGNLVCPALFDLGEQAKVVIFSVTEGEDKPLKYPHMFAAATVVILSKTDLLPHVRFDPRRARQNALTVNPDTQWFELSAQSGSGLDRWYDWLKSSLAVHAGAAA
jgi:hydrogenase nickel incorporation protein HypB